MVGAGELAKVGEDIFIYFVNCSSSFVSEKSFAIAVSWFSIDIDSIFNITKL